MLLELYGFSRGIAVAQPGGQALQEPAPLVQCSAISATETRLPEGMFPASLSPNRTGFLLVGDFVFERRLDVERMAEGSLLYLQQVAAALPVNAEDERVVDALVAKRTAGLGTRPLRRREGEPR